MLFNKKKQPMKLYTRIALIFTIAFTVLLIVSYILVFYFSQQIIFNENRSNLVKFSNYIINTIDENEEEILNLPAEKRLEFISQKLSPYMKNNALIIFRLTDSNNQSYTSSNTMDFIFSNDKMKNFNLDLFKQKEKNDLSEDTNVDLFTIDGSEYYNIGFSYVMTNGYTIRIQVIKNLNDSMMFMTTLYIIQVIFMLISVVIIILLGIYGTKKSLKPLIEIANITKEITEKKLNIRIKETGNQDELDQMINALNQMISQLEQAFEMQKRFVSDASHELRIPITIIQGYIEILMTWGKEDPAVSEEMIMSINNEAKQMGNLVENLLMLSRLENKYYTESFEKVNVDELLRTQCKEWTMIDSDHYITLENVQKCQINCNISLIVQAIRGVIENSVKYTPKGGIITLSCVGKYNYCLICIEDTGIGISDTNLENVRKRFFRVSSDRSRITGGNGLGLSIIDNIMQLHHGTMKIESKINSGTKVTLMIPTNSVLNGNKFTIKE